MAFEEMGAKLKAKSEISNNKSEIDKRESEISLLKLTLGGAIYDDFSSGGIDENKIKDACDEITAKLEEIDVFRDNIARIEAELGEKLDGIRARKQAAKEAKTAAEQAAGTAAPVGASPVCPKCGATCNAGSKFCGECGEKLTESDDN